MSYKLRAYRTAGGTICTEAIISCLLLYALLYILKCATRHSGIAAHELNKILSHHKAWKGIVELPIQVVHAITSPSGTSFAAGWSVGNGSLDEPTREGRLKVSLPEAGTVLQPQPLISSEADISLSPRTAISSFTGSSAQRAPVGTWSVTWSALLTTWSPA